MSDGTKPDLPTTEDASNTALDVVTENEGSTALDTIADLVSSLNLPVWVARNASKAFRKLCSAAVEWPAAFFKGKASERQAVTEANRKITETVTDQIIQQIQVPSEYAQIAVGKHLEKIIGEQLNLDKISAIAANELKAGDPNGPTNQSTSEPDKEQSANSPNQGTNSGEEKVIDDDWLNNLENEARSKSTEDMQRHFGRILAGEIRQPGSYSIKAVKLLGELNQDTAALFKKLCSMCIAFEDPVDRFLIDARLLPLDRNVAQGDLGKYSLNPYEIDLLSQYNLVGSTQNSLYPYNLCIGSENNRFPQPFQHQGQDWVLWPFSEWDAIKEFHLMGFPFSLIGRELFRIVAQDPMPEYTKDIKKFFEEQNLRMIEAPIL